MLLLALGCVARPPEPPPASAGSSSVSPTVLLPRSGGPRAPSALAGDVAGFADVDLCADCHPDAAAAWSTSAHAHASLQCDDEVPGCAEAREPVPVQRISVGR